MDHVRRNAELDALYAELPAIDCQGLCHDSCGPIEMSDAELQRTVDAGAHIPAGNAFRDGLSYDCPALTLLKRCSVYAVRPLVCRIWGLTKRMPCRYGCRPSRWLSEPEAFALLARTYEISGQTQAAAHYRKAALPENQARVTYLRDRLNMTSRITHIGRGMA